MRWHGEIRDIRFSIKAKLTILIGISAFVLVGVWLVSRNHRAASVPSLERQVPAATQTSEATGKAAPVSAPPVDSNLNDSNNVAPQQGEFIKSLVNKAQLGDEDAKWALREIAIHPTAGKGDRLQAINYLGQDKSKESLVALAQLLLSLDQEIRASAYRALPDMFRPAGYDYTSDPSPTNRSIVEALEARIRQQ